MFFFLANDPALTLSSKRDRPYARLDAVQLASSISSVQSSCASYVCDTIASAVTTDWRRLAQHVLLPATDTGRDSVAVIIIISTLFLSSLRFMSPYNDNEQRQWSDRRNALGMLVTWRCSKDSHVASDFEFVVRTRHCSNVD